jgi:hypothetical protein
MSTLGGFHEQAGSGRRFAYWAAYEVSDAKLKYVSVVSEALRFQGKPEGSIRFDPNGIPAEDIVRRILTRYIDETTFGVGKAPDVDPRWMYIHPKFRPMAPPQLHHHPDRTKVDPKRNPPK